MIMVRPDRVSFIEYKNGILEAIIDGVHLTWFEKDSTKEYVAEIIKALTGESS